MGLCAPEAGRVAQHLSAMGMKSQLSDIDGALPSAEALVDLMAQDKKVVDGQLHFIRPWHWTGIRDIGCGPRGYRDSIERLLSDTV